MSSVSASGLPKKATLLKFSLIYPPGVGANYSDKELTLVFSDTFSNLSNNVQNPHLKSMFNQLAAMYNTGYFDQSLTFSDYGTNQTEAQTKDDSILRYFAQIITAPFGVSQLHTSKEIEALRAWIYSPGNQAAKNLQKSYNEAVQKAGRSDPIKDSSKVRLMVSCADSAFYGAGNCAAPNVIGKGVKGSLKETPGVIKDYGKAALGAIPWSMYIGLALVAVLIISTATASATVTASKTKNIL